MQRRKRIEAPRAIVVDVQDLAIRLQSEVKAEAEFDQYYRSGPMRSLERKILSLEKRDGLWKIVRERTISSPKAQIGESNGRRRAE